MLPHHFAATQQPDAKIVSIGVGIDTSRYGHYAAFLREPAPPRALPLPNGPLESPLQALHLLAREDACQTLSISGEPRFLAAMPFSSRMSAVAFSISTRSKTNVSLKLSAK
jgi:hypothetical protein